MSNVRRFGAVGDGTTDDSDAIEHALSQGDGMLHFPPGDYRIGRTILLDLTRHGPVSVDGTGGTARILMTGPGPAFHVVGTHAGTGDPSSLLEVVSDQQRFPTIRNLVIEGQHAEADGIQLQQTMQGLLEGLLIRRCRHGIRLTNRNRNLLICHSHLYHNRGSGIFFDEVNLHQMNISHCHISYNRLGGIRIERSEVRNLQITGNDIEYNNHEAHATPPETSAEILIDATAAASSVNEVTIDGNTIQSTSSPRGCNVRIAGEHGSTARPPGLITISGNVIGSQETNIHLTDCYGVSLQGNTIYSGHQRNLLIENSRQIVVAANTFRRHTPNMHMGIRLVDSTEITISGCGLRDEHPEGQPSDASLLELIRCQRVTISGSQFIDGVPCGIDVSSCEHVQVTGCTFHDTRETRRSQHAIRFVGEGRGNLLAMNSVGPTLDTQLALEKKSRVTTRFNLI